MHCRAYSAGPGYTKLSVQGLRAQWMTTSPIKCWQILTSVALQRSLRGGWDKCCRHPRIFGSRLGRIRPHAGHAKVISNHESQYWLLFTCLFLSTDTSVEELRETTEALQKAAVNYETCFPTFRSSQWCMCNYWSLTCRRTFLELRREAGQDFPGSSVVLLSQTWAQVLILT